jgi:hypothetical protein
MLEAEGPVQTIQFVSTRLYQHAASRLAEEFYERRFGIRTKGGIPVESLGFADPDAMWYSPTPYPGFFKAMKQVPVSGAFIDYGSGKGRALIAAGTFPFVRVTGVELSQSLVAASQDNIARAKRTVCRNIEAVCANAAEWPVPADATVFHFFNPFRDETLRKVVTNIAGSLRETPRKAWILFANPWSMAPLMRSDDVMPLEWQRSRVDVLWPLAPMPKNDPDGHRYRIYALDSAPR